MTIETIGLPSEQRHCIEPQPLFSTYALPHLVDMANKIFIRSFSPSGQSQAIVEEEPPALANAAGLLEHARRLASA